VPIAASSAVLRHNGSHFTVGHQFGQRQEFRSVLNIAKPPVHFLAAGRVFYTAVMDVHIACPIRSDVVREIIQYVRVILFAFNASLSSAVKMPEIHRGKQPLVGKAYLRDFFEAP
jgi:hypothetical protein